MSVITETPSGATEEKKPKTSGKYLDFILVLFLAFGIAFEVPVAVMILTWTGLVDPQTLGSKRPYVIVGAFAIGMLLTPPDIISQTLLAIPMWLLFELGIVMTRFVTPRSQATGDEVEE